MATSTMVRLLAALGRDDRDGLGRVMRKLQDELHRSAAAHLRREQM